MRPSLALQDLAKHMLPLPVVGGGQFYASLPGPGWVHANAVFPAPGISNLTPALQLQEGTNLRLLFRSRIGMNQCLVLLPICEKSPCIPSSPNRVENPRLLSCSKRGVSPCPLFSSNRVKPTLYISLKDRGNPTPRLPL